MGTSSEALEELRKKIDQMEDSLIEMRKSLDQMIAVNENKPNNDWRSKFQWADKEELKKWFEEWRERNGVTNKPIGVEKLQEMLLKEGIKPEDNSFSKGIIEMREE